MSFVAWKLATLDLLRPAGTQEGNVTLPKYEVTPPDVNVTKKEVEVTVPKVTTQKETVAVPSIDIKTGKEREAEKQK